MNPQLEQAGKRVQLVVTFDRKGAIKMYRNGELYDEYLSSSLFRAEVDEVTGADDKIDPSCRANAYSAQNNCAPPIPEVAAGDENHPAYREWDGKRKGLVTWAPDSNSTRLVFGVRSTLLLESRFSSLSYC